MLDYAANATAYWRMEELRGWFDEAQRRADSDPESTLAAFMDESLSDMDEFWLRVRDNLQAGRVRCLFVADVIPSTLRQLVEFLNEHLDTVEVLAVELPQYVSADAGVRALVPRVVGRTARAQAAKGSRPLPGRQWSEESSMAAVREQHGSVALELCRAILAWCLSHEVQIWWGKGARDGSMVAVVGAPGVNHFTFTFWTFGTVEINFQYLKSRLPFADEELRRQLLERLNAAPGIYLPADSIGRRPSIPFEVLQTDASRQGFLAAMEWVTRVIRQAG